MNSNYTVTLKDGAEEYRAKSRRTAIATTAFPSKPGLVDNPREEQAVSVLFTAAQFLTRDRCPE
jgi:hypothetical protein